ncbi:KAP family NTPase [Pseudomonas sp. MDMC_285]|nr:KAP family NTPase [Pseudomonas sp. MDMC_285]
MTNNIPPLHNELKKRSCFSDQPIRKNDKDDLKNNQYAKGLLEFIKIADAPITIGIQGGWGSGKTSLINLLQNELETDGHSLCINVNAWQQSLFTDSSGGAIANSLLDAVYNSFGQSIAKSKLSDELKKEILSTENGLEAISKKLWQIGVKASTFVAKSAMRTVGIDPADSATESIENIPRPSQLFNELRGSLSKATEVLNQKTDYKNLVIFVDDLDRIQPDTAVEVLDVLKNIFDIEHCISILAIDYDVVIKGLQRKFGEKNHENEREFRQYFDKIIQIPFSMPVGSYKHNTLPLLRNLFSGLEIQISQEDLNDMNRVALKSTDGVPRSVKRIVNTLSLLRTINRVEKKSLLQGEPDESADDSEKIFTKVQFITVCLQINFPEIHRALSSYPAFHDWTIQEIVKEWKIDPQISQDHIDTHLSSAPEEWQKALLALTSISTWLKDKTEDILDIMNILKSVLANEDGLQILQEALNSTSVTSAEQTPQKKPANNTDSVTWWCRAITQEIIYHAEKAGHIFSPLEDDEYAIRYRGGRGNRSLSHLTNNPCVDELHVGWIKNSDSFSVLIDTVVPHRGKGKFKIQLSDFSDLLQEELSYEDGGTELFRYQVQLPNFLKSSSPESHIQNLVDSDEFKK